MSQDLWWRALGCDVGRGITSSLLSPAPRRQSSTKEPPAAFGVTVPHTAAAPRAHFTVGRGFSAGKVAKPSQQVWAVQMGNGNAPGAAPSPELCACPRCSLRSAWKHIQEGKAALGSCSLCSGCLPESTSTDGKGSRGLGSLPLLWDSSGQGGSTPSQWDFFTPAKYL